MEVTWRRVCGGEVYRGEEGRKRVARGLYRDGWCV
jgi:hypothetical protein